MPLDNATGGIAMKMPLAAVIAAVAAAVGLPASASAEPPVDAPPGSTCTFAKGITTCVQASGFGSIFIEEIEVEPEICPSGRAVRQTRTSTIVRTITVFRGPHQLGEPRTETETSPPTVTTNCI
jgi:hypothetical protein